MKGFHYREKGYYHSEEVNSSRYIYAALFEDKKFGTQACVTAFAVFYNNTEAYVEKLTLEITRPKKEIIKLIELDKEDMERIIPEVEVKFNERNYKDDILREINEFKQNEQKQ